MTIFVVLLLIVLATGARVADAHEAPRDRIRALTHTLEHHPDDVNALLQRADLYRVAGDPDHALADYERALRLEPARVDIRLDRALALLQQEDFAAALADADAYLAYDASVARAWRARAHALAGLGRSHDAIAAFDRALACDAAPSPDDYAERARIQARAGRGDEALAGLDAGMARLGPVVSLQQLAVELERERGHFDAALARLDAMRSQFDHTETLLVMRGNILADAGRTLEANAAYTEALRLIEARISQGRAVPATTRLRDELLHKTSAAGSK